jgi:hypothetical protein
MKGDFKRNLGEQPIQKIMETCKLTPHDLVEASTEQLTHKMVSRAMKGRRLTRHVKVKVLVALNKAAGKAYGLSDLFNYD